MSRHSPKSREGAFTYQFEDDVKLLHSLSLLNKEEFKKQLEVLQIHIDTYNDKDLQKVSEEKERKYKISRQYLSENYGVQRFL